MFSVLAILYLFYRPELGLIFIAIDLAVMYLGAQLMVSGRYGKNEISQQTCVGCEKVLATRMLEFKECRSYLLVRRERSVEGNLCWDCSKKLYREFQFNNLIYGWWSMPGLFRTPMLLMFNRAQLSRARALATKI